jgi:hypothetical protein
VLQPQERDRINQALDEHMARQLRQARPMGRA